MKYDLLLRNGEVVDPGAGLRGRMDVAVAAGKIAAVAAGLEPAEARRVVDVGGRFILPGLVDVHAHLFVNSSDMGENADRFCNASGVTTSSMPAAPARPISRACAS